MTEAIKKRVSVRTYLKKALSVEQEKAIKKIMIDIEQMKGPFGNQIKLYYDKILDKETDKKEKIGTYGFVKNGYTFIAGTCLNKFESIVDFGYLFEFMILKLTEIDLGTVWLGGTFNRHYYDEIVKEGEVVPAITPIGFASDKKSIREKIIRRVSKGDLRKPFEEIFFENDFDHPLDKDHALSSYLELIRIAPSASNKQPWRVIVKDKELSLYLERTPDYGKSLPYDIQALDMGIALCHLQIGLDQDKILYEFVDHQPLDHQPLSFKVIDIHLL